MHKERDMAIDDLKEKLALADKAAFITQKR